MPIIKKLRILTFVDQIADTTIPFELAVQLSKRPRVNVSFATFAISLEEDKLSNIEYILLPRYNIIYQVVSFIFYVKKHNINVIHTNHTKGALLMILISKILPLIFSNNIKWVHTVHNDYNFFKKFQKIIFKKAIINADKIICNSINTYNSLHLSINNYSVIYNGVNIKKVQLYKGNKPKSKIILSANRLVPQKNLITLLKAFGKLSPKYSDWNLYLCGDGPLLANLKLLANELGCLEKITFFGNVNREKVYKLMNTSSIYVTPSFWEGFCNANVEAMAAGNALINSDVQPLPEIAGDAALYFNPHNIDSLVEKLEILMSNNKKLEELRSIGYKRAELYDINIAAKNYNNFILK
mgnify:CR=1 FL=1